MRCPVVIVKEGLLCGNARPRWQQQIDVKTRPIVSITGSVFLREAQPVYIRIYPARCAVDNDTEREVC